SKTSRTFCPAVTRELGLRRAFRLARGSVMTHPPAVSPSARAAAASPPSPLEPRAADFLDRLVGLGLLTAADRATFLTERLERLRAYRNEERLGVALVHAGLLTPYQLERVLEGRSHGLMLGNYRVLDELGRRGMGTVY